MPSDMSLCFRRSLPLKSATDQLKDVPGKDNVENARSIAVEIIIQTDERKPFCCSCSGNRHGDIEPVSKRIYNLKTGKGDKKAGACLLGRQLSHPELMQFQTIRPPVHRKCQYNFWNTFMEIGMTQYSVVPTVTSNENPITSKSAVKESLAEVEIVATRFPEVI